MFTFTVLMAGFGFGLSVALPVGPIGLLCMNRTLASGFRYGFIGGLGTAAADACYGLLAVAGLYLVADALRTYSSLMEVIGGSFVVYLGTVGMRTYRRSPVSPQPDSPGSKTVNEQTSPAHRLTRSFFSMFGLTLTNPLTMLSFLALAASLQATASEDALTLAAGIFLGSSAWWLLLCLAVHFAGKALPAKLQRYLQLLSSVLLLAFGLVRAGGALLEAVA